MYLKYFKLAIEPFSVTSDPDFLWMSAQHEEALAHLVYAIQQRRGFALLTGEIGTGKTTLINSLLNQLDENTKTAVIYNATLDTLELFKYMFADFAISSPIQDRATAVLALNDWLIEQANLDKNVVVIVDEAQNLSTETLEDLRLLSNLEAKNRKLIQIILVGQPELRYKLAQPELAQLKQRISIRFHLKAFEIDETKQYIKHRLSVAGAIAPENLFKSNSIGIIQATSGGVPRRINQICDLSLLKAFQQQSNVVTIKLVKSIIAEESDSHVNPGEAKRPSDGKHGTRSRVLLGSVATAFVLTNLLLIFLFLRTNDMHSTATTAESNHDERPAVSAKLVGVENNSKLPPELESQRTRNGEEAGPDDLNSHVVNRPDSERDESIDTDPQNPEVLIVRIKKNDTMVRLASRLLHASDDAVLREICRLNPQINDPNLIRAGEVIRLPKRKIVRD